MAKENQLNVYHVELWPENSSAMYCTVSRGPGQQFTFHMATNTIAENAVQITCVMQTSCLPMDFESV